LEGCWEVDLYSIRDRSEIERAEAAVTYDRPDLDVGPLLVKQDRQPSTCAFLTLFIRDLLFCSPRGQASPAHLSRRKPICSPFRSMVRRFVTGLVSRHRIMMFICHFSPPTGTSFSSCPRPPNNPVRHHRSLHKIFRLESHILLGGLFHFSLLVAACLQQVNRTRNAAQVIHNTYTSTNPSDDGSVLALHVLFGNPLIVQCRFLMPPPKKTQERKSQYSASQILYEPHPSPRVASYKSLLYPWCYSFGLHNFSLKTDRTTLSNTPATYFFRQVSSQWTQDYPSACIEKEKK
jgi:hypothetical protein